MINLPESYLIPFNAHVRNYDGTMDFDYLCELGLAASEQMDERRWYIGELALLVETHYSEKTLAEYARRIKVKQSTVYDYRRCARMMQTFSTARNFLDHEQYPTLCWSHFRAASYLKTEIEVISFLERCASDCLTIEAAENLTANEKAESKGKPIEFTGYREEVMREISRQLDNETQYRILIYKVTEER